jgi:uroporphyrinogen-III synthase
MDRPLSGLRILVTRARKQASDLSVRLEQLGATPVVLPSIEVQAIEETRFVDEALTTLADFDWVVFTSVNGVEATVARLDALGLSRDLLAGRKLAVVGPTTATTLAKLVRSPDVVPDRYTGSAILDKLPDVDGRRFLFFRGDLANGEVTREIATRGGVVEDIVVYRTVKCSEGGDEILEGPAPDVLTFTSSSGVRNTYARLRDAGCASWMTEAPVICIGPVTAATVRDIGIEPTAVAKESTISGLVQALVEFADHRGLTHA